jgi:hypothetical protein
MATNKYNIQDLFKLIWNYERLPYAMILDPTEELTAALGRPSFMIPHTTFKTRSDLGEPFYAKNALGIEVFMPITLEDKTSRKSLQLENTIISVRQKKTIVETSLVNRQGTVKEIISMDDWEIDIKGIIVSPDKVYYNAYPDGAVKDLKDMYKLGNALDIHNALTAICLQDGELVVIKELNFPEMRGVENAQGFELKCVSDLKFDLIVS